MAALSYAEQVQQAYLAYYGRPADPAGQQYWVNQLTAANGNLNSIINAFGNSAESTALYGGSSTAAQVNAIYQTLFGRAADVTGLNFYVNGIVNGQFTLASVALNIYNGATGPDATELAAKLGYADSFTAALTQSAAGQVAYSGNAAANNARAAVASVVDSTSQATATAALSTTIANIGTGAVAQTFTLTTGVDTLTGTSGNDVFVADNTAGSGKYTSGVADSINGAGGVNTLKIYSDGTATGQALPGLTNVQNLWINNAGASVDVSKVAGVTSLQIDAPAAAATTFTLANQSFTLSNDTTTGRTYTIASTADVSESVTLSNVSNATANTLDLSGSKVTTLNLTATGAADAISLTNTGGALTTINVTGDKALTLTESIGTVKAVNASADIGGVTLDAHGAVTLAGFTFTGGAGNDVLKVAATEFGTLTSGAQLDGGAGVNTLAINDATLSSSVYTALNATKNFQILELDSAATVDASQITAGFANHFAVANTGANVISNMADGSTVDITAASTTDNFGASVGAQTLNLNIGTAKSAGLNVGTVTTGFGTINLSSNGTAANTIAFANNDNAKIVVTGSDNLTLSVAAGTTTGDKIDASAFTGSLTVTGSNQGDVIIGGSGNDTITAGAKSSTLTGGAGADNFKVGATVYGAAGQMDTITDFAKGSDSLTLGVHGTAAFNSTAVNVASASSFTAALNTAVNALADGTTNAQVNWFQYGGSTYVVESQSAAHATVASTDTVVKLTGAIDLSTTHITGATAVLA